MKPLISITAALALSACANTPCDWTAAQLRDCIAKVQRGELRAEDCACDAPTATIQVMTDRRGEAKPAPKADKPRDDDKTVDDSGMFDGKEPARCDYDNEGDYREAHDRWKEGRG